MQLGMRRWWMEQRTSTGELTGNQPMDDHFADEFARTPAHIGRALALMEGGIFDIEASLPRITAPTLLLVPGASTKTSRADQQRIAGRLPHGRMKIHENGKIGRAHV